VQEQEENITNKRNPGNTCTCVPGVQRRTKKKKKKKEKPSETCYACPEGA
jgi:hypothetical protein